MGLEQKSFHSIEANPQLSAVPQVGSSTILLSSPLQVDLDVYRGDSGSFRVSVKNADGTPIDVSAATWRSDIRLDAVAPNIIANFDIEPVVDDPSSIDVALSPTSSQLLSGPCVYDIQMTLDTKVTTIIKGNIDVTQDVSWSK